MNELNSESGYDPMACINPRLNAAGWLVIAAIIIGAAWIVVEAVI